MERVRPISNTHSAIPKIDNIRESHACFFATTTAKKTEGDYVLLVLLGYWTLENLGHFLACEFFGWCYGYTPRMSAATEELPHMSQ